MIIAIASTHTVTYKLHIIIMFVILYIPCATCMRRQRFWILLATVRHANINSIDLEAHVGICIWNQLLPGYLAVWLCYIGWMAVTLLVLLNPVNCAITYTCTNNEINLDFHQTNLALILEYYLTIFIRHAWDENCEILLPVDFGIFLLTVYQWTLCVVLKLPWYMYSYIYNIKACHMHILTVTSFNQQKASINLKPMQWSLQSLCLYVAVNHSTQQKLIKLAELHVLCQHLGIQ